MVSREKRLYRLNRVQIGLFKHTLLCIKLKWDLHWKKKNPPSPSRGPFFLQSLRTADETQHTLAVPPVFASLAALANLKSGCD